VVRQEKKTKEELARPEFMSKPNSEWTDEETKQAKDYEKKLQAFKEEQEKLRKALETELRKLQGSILETSDGFDAKLKDLGNEKHQVENLIKTLEILMGKLFQAIYYCENMDEQVVERPSLIVRKWPYK
jgi:molecular chaperone GrpE (heat shock protein)